MSKNWYKVENENGQYYTCYPDSISKAVPITKTRQPKPQEFSDAWNSLEQKYKGAFNSSYSQNGCIVSRDCSQPVDVIDPGSYYYEPSRPGEPERFVAFEPSEEIHLLTSQAEAIEKRIRAFIEMQSLYAELKLLHKLGILLYGEPGCGKTSFIRDLCKRLIKDLNAVCIFMSNFPSQDFLNAFKSDTIKDVLKIFVLEELYVPIQRGRHHDVLAFLDGEFSPDHAIILATTNTPELIPENLVNRPSRFDMLEEFKSPNTEQAIILLRHYLKAEPCEAEISACRGKSAAAIKEMCLRKHLFGIALASSAELADRRSLIVKRAFRQQKEVGFE